MTVLTIPTRPSRNAGLRPVPWRRMAWVTWRQHRPTLISLPVVLGAVAVFLWIAGLKIHHCLLYTSPSPRDRQKSRMPSSA